MQQRFQRASLAPSGFAVDDVTIIAERVQVRLRSRSLSGTCPACGRQSRRVQSRYLRRPADLPFGGRRVELAIVTRRFWCDAVLCGRRIFCEQFDSGVLARYGRRTQRLETIVHHLGLALGGRPAAAFANRLMVPVSNDTLLRVVRRRVADQDDELTVIGMMILLSGGGKPMGRSSAIWSGGSPSPCYRIERWIRLERGLPGISRSPPSLAIGAAAMVRPLRRRCPMLSRLLIAGT